MNNEQCIEVAEKVWGWAKTENPNERSIGSDYEYLYVDENGDYQSTKSYHISDDINSWSGFGRTVEAMIALKRGGYPSLHHAICCGLTDGDKAEQIIEATHLAALEAINNG